jgi:phage shock protein C
MKKLYRSRANRVWKGVLGGFGEYFNVDPVMLRVVFILFVLVTGIFPGVLAYIISIFVIPNAPTGNYTEPIKIKSEEVKTEHRSV